MSYETILFTVDRGIARLTLNRPEKLNSFNTQMHEEVRHALENLNRSDARVLVLAGAGRGFCAGQDLSREPDAWARRITLNRGRDGSVTSA